jgi:lactoylglutathione lyase
MSVAPKPDCNVRQVVPFFRVSDMDRSARFYIDGLGCTMKQKWVVDEKLRWCWLELGGAALMQCEDAVTLYREFISRGLEASDPQVGNSMWVTLLPDPDGYRLEFESSTDTPEETKLSDPDC